jgi:hypothetical protein
MGISDAYFDKLSQVLSIDEVLSMANEKALLAVELFEKIPTVTIGSVLIGYVTGAWHFVAEHPKETAFCIVSAITLGVLSWAYWHFLGQQ